MWLYAASLQSQICTSKHFYDVTAHQYIKENCLDLGLKTIRGLSADMDDLLTEKRAKRCPKFFSELIFKAENDIYEMPCSAITNKKEEIYTNTIKAVPKNGGKNVVIVTNCAENDSNLRNMIEDFKAAFTLCQRGQCAQI